jgi:hypothetical protein
MKKIGAVYVLAFPIMLTIGIVLIPVVPDYTDHAVAAEAVSQTVRWFAGHILSAVAFGISILSVHSIKRYLSLQGYELPDFIPAMMAVGVGLYAAGLGADGIGPIAVEASSSDPTLFFNGSGWWVSGTFFAATVFFGIGLISLVGHANHAQMVNGVWRVVIFISALLFVIFPAILSGWSLYGVAVAVLGVFIPLGLVVNRSS